MRKLSEPEKILLKKAQINKNTISLREAERILKEKSEREYAFAHGKLKYYGSPGGPYFMPGYGRRRVQPEEIRQAGKFLERLVALGLLGKEADCYRLTPEGERVARLIPFKRPFFREI